MSSVPFPLAAATKGLEQLKADDLTGINDEEHGKETSMFHVV